MTTIQIEVKDDLVKSLGLMKIRKLIQDKLDVQEFGLAADHLKKAMDEAAAEGVNWEKEFEQIRQESWEEYKIKRDIR